MKDIEGLVIQGCGSDLNEWVDGRTNLLFHVDGVDLDMGKLAMWRLASHCQFGGTWLCVQVKFKNGKQIVLTLMQETIAASKI